MLAVSLKNYRRFPGGHNGEPHTVLFPPGLTVVTGPNGAGKSTLVEAVEYCLFGPRKGRSRRLEERSDAASGDPQVCCTFEVEGQCVTVERNGSAASLTLDGNKLAITSSAVEEELRRLLSGLNRDEYEQTYVALQGDTAGLVEARASLREKTIEQILQFDVLSKAVDDQRQTREATKNAVRFQGGRVADELNLTVEVRDFLQSCLQAQKTVSRIRHLNLFLQRARVSVAKLERAAEEATQRRENADKAVDDKTSARTQAEGANRSAQQIVQRYDELEQQFVDLELKIRDCRAKRETRLQDVQDLAEMCEVAKGYADAAQRHHALHVHVAAAQERLAALGTIKERHERLARAQSRVSLLITQLDESEDATQLFEEASKRLSRAEAAEAALQADPTAEEEQAWHSASTMLDREAKDAREALAALVREDDQSECPTCDRPLGLHEHARLVSRLRADLEDAFPRRRAELVEQRRSIDQQRTTWQEQKDNATRRVKQGRREYDAARDRLTVRNQLTVQIKEAQDDHARAGQAWAALGEPVYDSDEASRVTTKRDALRREAAQLQSKVEIHSRLDEYMREMAEKRAEAKEWQQKVEKHLSAQATLGYEPDAHQAAKDAEQSSATAVAAAERVLGEATTGRALRLSEENSAIEIVERVERELGRLETDSAQLNVDSKLLDLLDEFKNHFFSANTRLVAKRTTELLLRAISDGSILGIEFLAGGELVYLDASYVARPVERLSGGEKALLGLCLRIALAEQALRIAPGGRLDFLFLDEVLSALDDERREGVQRVLDEVQRGGVFQHIVMITHLDAVKDGWRGATLEVRKLDGKRSELISGISANGPRDFEMEAGEDDLL